MHIYTIYFHCIVTELTGQRSLCQNRINQTHGILPTVLCSIAVCKDCMPDEGPDRTETLPAYECLLGDYTKSYYIV